MKYGVRKYRNVACCIDGVCFDSKREAARWLDLLNLVRLGQIKNLERQVRFEICPKVPGQKGSRKRFYVADFVYEEKGRMVIEDVKSPITRKNPVYSLKKQLVQVKYPDYIFREVM